MIQRPSRLPKSVRYRSIDVYSFENSIDLPSVVSCRFLSASVTYWDCLRSRRVGVDGHDAEDLRAPQEKQISPPTAIMLDVSWPIKRHASGMIEAFAIVIGHIVGVDIASRCIDEFVQRCSAKNQRDVTHQRCPFLVTTKNTMSRPDVRLTWFCSCQPSRWRSCRFGQSGSPTLYGGSGVSSAPAPDERPASASATEPDRSCRQPVAPMRRNRR